MSFGIRSPAHNVFISAQPDGSLQTRPSLGGDWEKFKIEGLGGGHVAIRSAHGYVLSVQPDGRIEKRPGVGGAWEKVTIVKNADGSVAFRSAHGTFLCSDAAAPGGFIWNRPAVGPWESFHLIPVRVLVAYGASRRAIEALLRRVRRRAAMLP